VRYRVCSGLCSIVRYIGCSTRDRRKTLGDRCAAVGAISSGGVFRPVRASTASWHSRHGRSGATGPACGVHHSGCFASSRGGVPR